MKSTNKKLTLVSQLEDVLYIIRTYEKRLEPDYMDEWIWGIIPHKCKHDNEIARKCLAYWQRRANRIIKQLTY